MLRSQLERSRIVGGLVYACGNWEPFSVRVTWMDAFVLAADITDFEKRYAAARALDVNPTALPQILEDNDAAYRRLAPKVKGILEKPRDKSRESIKMETYLMRKDFKIERIARIRTS